jgi:hypothetical protein
MTNILLEGDPLNPCDTDLIVQDAQLDIHNPVPEGWRVLTGNLKSSLIMRVAYRYEIEREMK